MSWRGGLREHFNPEAVEGNRAKDCSWTAALVIELDDMLEGLTGSEAGRP